MNSVVVITQQTVETLLESEVGAGPADEVETSLFESLIEEHSGQGYDIAILDREGDRTAVDHSLPSVDVKDICERWSTFLLLSSRSLIPNQMVEQALKRVESGMTVLGTSPRGQPVLYASTTASETASNNAEKFVQGVPLDVDQDTVSKLSDELFIESCADIPATITWSKRSNSFQQVHEACSEFDRPVSLSLVTATYKRPDDTKALIDSVKQSLSHFHERNPSANLEVEHRIVCYEEDYESLYKLEDVEGPPPTIQVSPHYSVTGKRDAGIQSARGEYIVSIDSDCLVHEDWISRIYRSIRLHRFPGAIQGAYDIDYPPDRNWYTEYACSRDRVRWSNRKADSRNLLYKKSVYQAIGGFNLQHTADAAEDNVLRERIEGSGKEFIMDESIRAYHRYPTTLLGNLKRHRYFGEGDHFMKTYSKEMHRRAYNPLARAAQLVQWTLALRAQEGLSFPYRIWVVRFFQVVAYAIGYFQGMKSYLQRRYLNSKI